MAALSFMMATAVASSALNHGLCNSGAVGRAPTVTGRRAVLSALADAAPETAGGDNAYEQELLTPPQRDDNEVSQSEARRLRPKAKVARKPPAGRESRGAEERGWGDRTPPSGTAS